MPHSPNKWMPFRIIALFLLCTLFTSCTSTNIIIQHRSITNTQAEKDTNIHTSTKMSTPEMLSQGSSGNSVIKLPPQGLYESCLPDEISCMDRLTEFSKGGFTIVLNDGLRYATTKQSIVEYADRAYSLGILVILPIKYTPDWNNDASYLVKKFPTFASECQSRDNKSFLVCYISVLKDHPALWGYYIADEPDPQYSSGLGIYSEFIKSLDPTHPRLIVVAGTNDPMEVFFTFHSNMAISTDILGLDYYPYGYKETFTRLSRLTGESARMGQDWATRLDLNFVMVLQAFSMIQYYRVTDGPLCMPWPFCATFPTYDQMKAQRDQVLLNSQPKFLLWFSYPDILNSDSPKQHWENLVNAAFSPPPEKIETPTPVPQICPSGWSCEDVGNPLIEGTQSFLNGTWTVQASGWDIRSIDYEKADQFRFIWREMVGDGEFSARAVDQSMDNAEGKMGLMLRSTIDPVSPFYAILVNPSTGVQVQYRGDFDQNLIDLISVNQKKPVWLKIIRKDTTFQAAISVDGLNWSLIPGSRVGIPKLQDLLMAGLAVTSRNENVITTAFYEQVELVEY
jgi:hypothetical protein